VRRVSGPIALPQPTLPLLVELFKRDREDEVQDLVVIAAQPRPVDYVYDFVFAVVLRDVVEGRFSFFIREERPGDGARFRERDQLAAVKRVREEHVRDAVPIHRHVLGDALDEPERRPPVVVTVVARVYVAQFLVHEEVGQLVVYDPAETRVGAVKRDDDAVFE